MAQGAKKRIRTCIGCGAQAGKTDLKRIVRRSDGTVAFDPTGRLAGRGAYVCSIDCMATAFRQNKLQRALKAAVSQEQAELVARELESAFSCEEVR